MSSRERVLAALNHQEPDRVHLDMGGTIMSGIMAHALDRLRMHLNLPQRAVKVYEVFQMLGEVEMDVVDRLGIDILPVEPPVQFFGLRREQWKPWKLWDGTKVLVPGQFDVEVDEQGDWLLHSEGDPTKPVEGRMPKNGFYFDMASMTDTHLDYDSPAMGENIDILGLDILNPVQTSAAGMDPAWLNREFGATITFWGGGMDTQSTLPFAAAYETARTAGRHPFR
jgi:hypothetical protein